MKRQGDVLLVKVDKIPTGATLKDNVLARGEATGHSHRITKGKTYAAPDGQQYVVLEQPSQLVHEEHDTIPLEKGKYKVLLQREYDVVAGIRQVLD